MVLHVRVRCTCRTGPLFAIESAACVLHGGGSTLDAVHGAVQASLEASSRQITEGGGGLLSFGIEVRRSTTKYGDVSTKFASFIMLRIPGAWLGSYRHTRHTDTYGYVCM